MTTQRTVVQAVVSAVFAMTALTTACAKKDAAPAPAHNDAAAPLAVGDRAPDFEVVAHDGKTYKLSALAGHPVVLYFYPKADTPG